MTPTRPRFAAGRVLMLACLAVLCLPFACAHAASFDCDAAETPIEVSICSDDTLSATDGVLGVAYETAIGGLSDAAAETMRLGQREWIDFTHAACADDVLPGNEAADIERVSCLQGLYDGRIAMLQNSRMFDGLRFYLDERFAALPDDSGDSWAKVATKELSVPKIDGHDALAKAFNRYMDKEIKAHAAAFDPDAEATDDEIGIGGADSDVITTYTLSEVNYARITLQVYEYWYGHGAAHGNYGITMRHFIRDGLRPLKASDIFSTAGWEDKLAALAFKALVAARGKDGLFVSDADEIVDMVSDPLIWDFSDQGLELAFQPYAVASYADGIVKVTIPWQKLDDLLAERAYNITYY